MMTLEEASAKIDAGEAPEDVMRADAEVRRRVAEALKGPTVSGRRAARVAVRRAAVALAAALHLWGVR